MTQCLIEQFSAGVTEGSICGMMVTCFGGSDPPRHKDEALCCMGVFMIRWTCACGRGPSWCLDGPMDTRTSLAKHGNSHQTRASSLCLSLLFVVSLVLKLEKHES